MNLTQPLFDYLQLRKNKKYNIHNYVIMIIYVHVNHDTYDYV